MSSDLDIWLGDRLIAHTVSKDRGNKVRIIYTGDVGATYGPEADHPTLDAATAAKQTMR